MGFDDADDDYWGFPDPDDPPNSPIIPYVHPSSYSPVVNAQDREREAKILSSIDTEQGKTLQRRASNEAAFIIPSAGLQLYTYSGSSSSSSALPPTVIASATFGVPILAVTAPIITTPPRRGLKREHSALTDNDVSDIPSVPTRRRLITKTSDLGPEWPMAPRLDNDMRSAAASTEQEDSSVYPLPISTGALDSHSDILCDEVISTALSALSSEIIEHKMINRMTCRTLLRGGVVKHCRELLLSKISKGEIAAGTTGLSQGKRLHWGLLNI